MRKMPFRFARRVRNLEIKTYCPTKRKHHDHLNIGRGGSFSSLSSGGSSNSSSSQQICPSCVLPIVVAFIFGFTVIQLIVIHRTIVAYKSRSLAFEEVYGPSHNDTKSQGDLLAFSKKFDAAWHHSSGTIGKSSSSKTDSSFSSKGVEWLPTHSYPYRRPHYPSNINHIWGEVACPEVPAKLHGNISINIKKDVSLDELTRHNGEVQPGGKWSPKECSPRYHVALIIPYRFRWSHLKLLLSVLHPMLRRQQMSYQIFVAEQFGNYTFNKGLLMNAAFLLALNQSKVFNCVIFHDVDLLPETDRNIYGCLNSPSHLSVSIDAYGYRLPYSKLVGGVFAISVEHFIQVNGYSNLYWGWGAEDDDILIANQLPISRPRPDLAKYKMLQHGRRVPNQFINPLIRTARLRFPQDGLTTCHFRLVSSTAQSLFTHFLVDVGQPSYSVLEPNVPLESLVPSSRPHTSPTNPSNPSHQHPHSSHDSRDSHVHGYGVSGHNSKSYNHNSHPPSVEFSGISHRKQQKRSIILTTERVSHDSHDGHDHDENQDLGKKNGNAELTSHTQLPTQSPTQSQSVAGEKELYILKGIARDSDNHNHNRKDGGKQGGVVGGKFSFGFGSTQHLSSRQSLSPGKMEMTRTRQMVLMKGGSGNNDIPLDPDVPVEQDDDDDEDEENDEDV